MKYHVIYLETEQVMFSGTLKQCQKFFRAYKKYSHYKILTCQQIKQLSWEF